MDEIQGGLRYLMQTDSKYTLMVSGTGHAGMEACISNLVEPGEKVGCTLPCMFFCRLCLRALPLMYDIGRQVLCRLCPLV